MNEQYLWDRTGDDPEIKRLEEALAGFRYQEIAPPVLPVTTAAAITGTKLSWRFSLPLAFAAVAVIATVIVSAIVLDRNARQEVPMLGDLLSTRETANERFAPSIDIIPTMPSISAPLPDRRPKYAAIRKPRARNPHRPTIAKMQKEVVLTSEEKDAYNRLLLALSITGSKLKIVSDTINRTDEDKTGRDPNNR